MLLGNWPERAGVLYGSHVLSTKTVTGLTGGYLAGTIEDNANFRPPIGDMIPDPDAYLKRVGGMRSLNAYLDTFPRRVREHEAAGMDLADAIGQEKRALQGLAIGDPYRTWRKITEDVTTANVNPMWRGWVRVPEPGACAFCRMLATRGAVYTENSGNFRSHNRCRCTARAALDEGAAAYINAEGAAAWQEMLATGDVPKLSPELRRRGAFTQQRVDEINKRLTNLANAQRAAELRVARNRELGIKRTPSEHGRDGYRAKLIREYRDERSTILNATKGNPPRTRKGSKKIKDQQGVDTAPQTQAGGVGGGNIPPTPPRTSVGGGRPDHPDSHGWPSRLEQPGRVTRLDNSRMSADEISGAEFIATQLYYDVREIAKGTGRTADFEVVGADGLALGLELKTPGFDAVNTTIRNRIQDAQGQAADVVVDCRKSGLSEAEASRGVLRAFGAAANTGQKLDTVTLILRREDGTVYVKVHKYGRWRNERG